MYKEAPIQVNIYIIIAAIGSNYVESLLKISRVIEFFQFNTFTTPLSHPCLNPQIEQLNLDLYFVNFEQLNHIWATLGGKYYPSVLYKIRQLRLGSPKALEKEAPLINEIIINSAASN